MIQKIKRPVIGITQPSRCINPDYLAVCFAVLLAGGRPKLLTHRFPEPFPAIQGLILGGGRDILPLFFRQKSKRGYRYDFDRDSMEITYMGYAESHNIPILGICRGAQLINIVRDGTLHMQVRSLFSKRYYPNHPLRQMVFRKKITIAKNSLLHSIIQENECSVNSLHSQAIQRVGNGLIISAIEENGIVQAIEDPSMLFLLGVQFHPELLIYHRKYRRIFQHFVKYAKSICLKSMP